jgi:hypothetical protein
MSEEREVYRLPEGRTMALETPVKIYHRDIKHRPIEYIRADVAAAQLDAANVRIAELEASCIGYRHVAETEADRSLELEKRIAELEAAQRWVSVDERLPDDYENVITYVRHPKGPTAIDISGYSLKYGWSYPVKWEYGPLYATHWMPLPPPPDTDVTP